MYHGLFMLHMKFGDKTVLQDQIVYQYCKQSQLYRLLPLPDPYYLKYLPLDVGDGLWHSPLLCVSWGGVSREYFWMRFGVDAEAANLLPNPVPITHIGVSVMTPSNGGLGPEVCTWLYTSSVFTSCCWCWRH